MTDETDPRDRRIALRLVNNTESRNRYRYDGIDKEFRRLIDEFRHDAVHFNHVSHLSTNLVKVAHERGLPIVFTLHDFWLMCPRGQFIQRAAEGGEEPYPSCDGQKDAKCAERCYALYFSGERGRHELEVRQWAAWVGERLRIVRNMAALVDIDPPLILVPHLKLYSPKLLTSGEPGGAERRRAPLAASPAALAGGSPARCAA